MAQCAENRPECKRDEKTENPRHRSNGDSLPKVRAVNGGGDKGEDGEASQSREEGLADEGSGKRAEEDAKDTSRDAAQPGRAVEDDAGCNVDEEADDEGGHDGGDDGVAARQLVGGERFGEGG